MNDGNIKKTAEALHEQRLPAYVFTELVRHLLVAHNISPSEAFYRAVEFFKLDNEVKKEYKKLD